MRIKTRNMTIHKEGYKSLTYLVIAIILINLTIFKYDGLFWLKAFSVSLSAFLFIAVLQFFRNPNRKTNFTDKGILCPADGEIVVIEETEETEYFKDKRIQVSIFMSPTNVHVNRYPISGVVKHFKYHPGKFLIASKPKSSTENERTTVVVEHENKTEVLFRQIAGFVARRIVWYVKDNDIAKQGEEFGFIKFGSRVDLFLPLDTKINVKIGDTVRGAETIIAELK